MSNIFNINRFSKVVIRDIVSNWLHLVFLGLLLFGAVYLMGVVAGLMFESVFTDISASSRFKLISHVSMLIAVIAPCIIYRTVNDRKKGIDYIMLPASTLEKILSMIIVTFIIGHLSMLFIGFILDTLFSLLFPSIFNSFAIYKIDLEYILSTEFSALVFISLGILCSLIFRKNKVFKTLSVFIICSFMLLFGVIIYVINESAKQFKALVKDEIVLINDKELNISEIERDSLKKHVSAYIVYGDNNQIKESYNLDKLQQKFGVDSNDMVGIRAVIDSANIRLKFTGEGGANNMSLYSFNKKNYITINKGNTEYFLEVPSGKVNITKDYNEKELKEGIKEKIKKELEDKFILYFYYIILILVIISLVLSYVRLKRIQM